MQAFPHPKDASDKIWLQSAAWSWWYSCLKLLTDTQTLARVLSYKLTLWAFGSGELKTTKKIWRHHIPHYKSMGVFFRCSRADNSVAGGPIWPKFELVQDNMHVLVTYKFKMDRINSNREKGWHRFFKRSRAANSVISPQIWPKFIKAFMHVLITYKYEKEQTINSPEKVATPSFPL